MAKVDPNTVEDLIESEQFESVNQVFEAAYEELSQLSRQKGGLKKSRGARKAMQAIELVMDLLRELLAIKYRLQELGELRRARIIL